MTHPWNCSAAGCSLLSCSLLLFQPFIVIREKLTQGVNIEKKYGEIKMIYTVVESIITPEAAHPLGELVYLT